MSRFVNQREFVRSRPVDDPAGYKEWAQAQTSCHCCGINAGLTTHHIVKPGRSDEPCNLLRLCMRCHDLAEGRSIRQGGKLLPKLTLAHCLWLKREREPESYDRPRLARLYHRKLPRAAKPPAILTGQIFDSGFEGEGVPIRPAR